MIAIIDYDAGNIKSVEKALAYLGEEVRITRDREEILASDGVILPGVGAFGDAMEKLHTYGLVDVIREVVRRQIPFLGICLGLQLNDLTFPNKGRLFRGIEEHSYVYFVHSFYLEAADSSIVTATTEYGTRIHASVEKDNIFACQFHPEKSSRIGLKILQNFVDITKEYRDQHTQGGQ